MNIFNTTQITFLVTPHPTTPPHPPPTQTHHVKKNKKNQKGEDYNKKKNFLTPTK
jgi:hypothetical protein